MRLTAANKRQLLLLLFLGPTST